MGTRSTHSHSRHAVVKFLLETSHKRSHDRDKAMLAWLDPELGGKCLDEIDRNVIDRIKFKRADIATKATANRYLALTLWKPSDVSLLLRIAHDVRDRVAPAPGCAATNSDSKRAASRLRARDAKWESGNPIRAQTMRSRSDRAGSMETCNVAFLRLTVCFVMCGPSLVKTS